MRLVHTADWQLGMTRHFLAGSGIGGGSGDAQARFGAARFDAVRALGRLADAEGASAVIVCGDVFESNHVGPEVVARACEALRSFRTPVLLLPGNHDPADAASVLRRDDFVRRRPAHVTVLDTAGVVAPAPGLEVVAAPWSSKRPLCDLVADAVAGLDPAPPGVVRVVAGHGALDVLSPDPNDPAAIRTDALRAALADGRVHYVALGDRHSTWTLPGEPRVRYSGAPEVTDHDEIDPGNVLVVDVDPEAARSEAARSEAGRPDAVTARAVALGRWHFLRHPAAVDTEADIDALDAALDALPDKERTAVRLGLRGTLTLRARTRLDAVLAAHAHVFAALEHSRTRTELVTRPDDADLGELDLSGFAAAAARELHDAARGETGSSADAARDALALLHRLVGSAP